MAYNTNGKVTWLCTARDLKSSVELAFFMHAMIYIDFK